MNFRLPHGSDPGPEGVQKDIPIITGAVGAESDTPDPGQPRRLGPLAGPNRNGPRMNCPPHQPRDQAGRCREPVANTPSSNITPRDGSQHTLNSDQGLTCHIRIFPMSLDHHPGIT